jgi:outer membrane immunogenic protein
MSWSHGSQIYTDESTRELSGALYGGHIGYNLQFGHIVAGLEAGITAADFEDCESCDDYIGVKTTMDWYATAVARLGYAEGSWLLYGFGGLAWADAKEQMRDNLPPYYHGGDLRAPIGGAGGSSDLRGGETKHVGWTAGFGVEYALSQSFSVRAEYSHVDLGRDTVALGSYSDVLYTQSLSQEIDFTFDVVKIGASYKLFGPEQSIDALK